ncbi:hypothetical protein Ae201684P_007466 [Aphanomyces euteiches]|nr:hypothetical protein Ae201684P_007466 [Aphanomyces euteiches]
MLQRETAAYSAKAKKPLSDLNQIRQAVHCRRMRQNNSPSNWNRKRRLSTSTPSSPPSSKLLRRFQTCYWLRYVSERYVSASRGTRS